MSNQSPTGGHGFGTAPVFLAGISTILGAILFLRFGYAVAHAGIGGAVLLVLIGHAITIPTGLAVAEIATNLKVRGGGEYYIVSRSFGATLGGAIGISLFFSQAISLAFYLIAFAEAFRPLFGSFEAQTGIPADPRMISLPVGVLLVGVIARRGADVGVGLLWVIVAVLAVSLGMFFAGESLDSAPSEIDFFARVADPDRFFTVFAIVFPAFTGMTAGVGLSGDLRNPRRSIPLGTVAATLAGLVVYLLVVFKLGTSASAKDLDGDQLIMGEIALWGPIIPIGLAAASISSALGSILVAPRTLQALAADRIFPSMAWNRAMSRGRGEAQEPANATWMTGAIALTFVALGDVDFVAQIISMFFMITYGALCTISFLEHFAGNPSYRPTFRTQWYLSLVGAVASFVMMFQMQPLYAALSLTIMVGIYLGLSRSRKGERSLTAILKGVLFQATRKLQVIIQQKRADVDVTSWRPSFVAISRHSAARLAPFDMLRWISHYYGFGTYIHFIPGPLSLANSRNAKQVLDRLIEQTRASEAGIYVDTIVSPSFKTAVAQIVQIPGIAGMDNNSILFEFNKDDPRDLDEIIDGSYFAAIAGLNICILRSGERHFGYRKSIDIWLTPGDYGNANLMILLAYILLGHPEWKGCEIRLFDTYEGAEAEPDDRLSRLIADGRLPIARSNVRRLRQADGTALEELVAHHSASGDLVVMGLSLKKMRRDGGAYLKAFGGNQEVLFVRAGQEILITDPDAKEEIWDEERHEDRADEEPGADP